MFYFIFKLGFTRAYILTAARTSQLLAHQVCVLMRTSCTRMHTHSDTYTHLYPQQVQTHTHLYPQQVHVQVMYVLKK